MLYYDKIDISEGSDINKTSASKECIICHYWYFLDKGFKFQSYVSNSCQNIITFGITNITIFNNHGVTYPCNMFGIT